MTRSRLLLVDDAPDLALILTRTARRLGVDFVSRPDARSAYEWLSESSADLTLLDVNLPGMSGIELLSRLRGQPQTARLKVALFCQPELSGDIAAGWKAGADYLVSKELISCPDALQERLAEILAQPHGRPAIGSLTCPTTSDGSVNCDWSAVERVMRLPAALALGDEVLTVIWKRAFSFVPNSRIEQESLARPALPPALPRRALFACVNSLADQLWCLLGKDAGPLNEALQAAVDRLLA